MILDVRYAKAADGTHVAYAELGDGPIDIVYSFGYLSNIDDFAEWDMQTALWNGLSSFSRLIVFDRRGSGLSDPTSIREENTLEAGMDDIRAVMDAAGSERALVVGLQDGGMLCTLFAASHPDRTLGLVLYGSSPRGLPASDFPWAWTVEEWDDYLSSIEQTWGTPEQVEDQLKLVFPSVTYSPDELKRIAARTVRWPAPAPPSPSNGCFGTSTCDRSCRRSGSRPSSSTPPAIRSSRSAPAGISPSRSPVRGSSSCPAPITCRTVR